MNTITELQSWYLSQCVDDWEHSCGVKVETLDNPGWLLKIDLIDTEMQNVEYTEYSYGVGIKADSSGNNWLHTKVEGNQYVGYGGPEKLQELIRIFLGWVKSNS